MPTTTTTTTLREVLAVFAAHYGVPSMADVGCCYPTGHITHRDGRAYYGLTGYPVRMPTGDETVVVAADGRVTDTEGGWLVDRLPGGARARAALRKAYFG